MEDLQTTSTLQREWIQQIKSKLLLPNLILSVISKVMKRSVQIQVLKYMDDLNQFNKNLHGYKSLHSTTTSMLQLSDYISEAADSGLIYNASMINQLAVFDCVNAAILDENG